MASHRMHFLKGGSGFASKTACGRNILSAPLGADWQGFKQMGAQYRCTKCEASKLAEFMRKQDAKKSEATDAWEPDLDAWVPVNDPDAWKRADDAMLAARRARKAQAAIKHIAEI